jgi:hypothetical protein
MRNAVVLPHPEGPQERHERAIRHLQVERVQGCERIESLADALVRDRAHRESLAERSRFLASSDASPWRSRNVRNAAPRIFRALEEWGKPGDDILDQELRWNDRRGRYDRPTGAFFHRLFRPVDPQPGSFDASRVLTIDYPD